MADYNQTLEQQVQERTIAVQQEIAERKRTEAAPNKSQYFLQTIADTIPKILYLFDLSEGKAIYLNQQSLKQTRLPDPRRETLSFCVRSSLTTK